MASNGGNGSGSRSEATRLGLSDAFSVVASGFTFCEGPRWHDGHLWWSDFYTQRVWRVVPGQTPSIVVEVPNQPSGLGWLPDGRLLIVSMRDQRILRLEADGSLVEHADLSSVATGHVNDMVVDGHGRAYVGNFGFDLMGGGRFETADLARVDPDGRVEVVAAGLMFPNGAMVTPDGSTLLVAESAGNRISSFAIATDGSLGPRQDWATFGAVPQGDDMGAMLAGAAVSPDGAALDAQGGVWVADAGHNRVIRVTEGGTITDEISTGDIGVFACALGGEDRKTLFACVAPDFFEHARAAARDAMIVATPVEIPGAGWP